MKNQRIRKYYYRSEKMAGREVMEDTEVVVVIKRNGWIDAQETVKANAELIESTALNGIRRVDKGKERVIKLRYPADLEDAIVRALKEALSIVTEQRSYNG